MLWEVMQELVSGTVPTVLTAAAGAMGSKIDWGTATKTRLQEENRRAVNS